MPFPPVLIMVSLPKASFFYYITNCCIHVGETEEDAGDSSRSSGNMSADPGDGLDALPEVDDVREDSGSGSASDEGSDSDEESDDAIAVPVKRTNGRGKGNGSNKQARLEHE